MVATIKKRKSESKSATHYWRQLPPRMRILYITTRQKTGAWLIEALSADDTVQVELEQALGTAAGGWRIMKTMGQRVVKLDPVHGFAAETTAASIIMVASHFGMPVSTTHVISTAIMGVGTSDRIKAVRWGIARGIITAWILTIPCSAAIAATACLALHVVGL